MDILIVTCWLVLLTASFIRLFRMRISVCSIIEGFALGIIFTSLYFTLVAYINNLVFRYCLIILYFLLLITGGILSRYTVKALLLRLKYKSVLLLGRSKALWVILFSIFVIIKIVECYAPITAWDSLVLHMTVPKLLVKGASLSSSGKMDFWFAYHPISIQMIFFFLMNIVSEMGIRFFSLILSLFLALSVYKLGKVLLNSTIGLYSVLFLVTSPIFLKYLNVTYIDIPLAFFFIAASIELALFWKEKRNFNLILFFLFSSFLPAIKMTGLLYFLLLASVFACLSIRREKFFKFAIKFLCLFIFFIIISGHWYIRSKFLTGDFLAGLYKAQSVAVESRINRKKDVKRLNFFKRQFKIFFTEQFYYKEMYKDRHRPNKATGFLLIPWDLTFKSKLWLNAATIGPIYLMLIPIYFLFYKEFRFKKINCLLLGILSAFIPWFFILKLVNVRYLFPVIPFMCITSGFIYYKIKEDKITFFNMTRKYMRALVALVVFLNIYGIFLINEIKVFFKGNVTNFSTGIKRHSRRDRLSFSYGEGLYEAINYLNAINRNDTILTNDCRVYHLDGSFISPNTLGDKRSPYLGTVFTRNFSTNEELHDWLTQQEVDYILFAKRLLPNRLKINNTYMYMDEVLSGAKWAKVVKKFNNEVIVYKIYSQAIQ